MEQSTFQGTMQGAMQGLMMARMMRQLNFFSMDAPGADFLAAMGINPISMEIAEMLGPQLQYAQDVPEQARPFCEAMARVSECLNPQNQEQDDTVTLGNNDFSDMPGADEMLGELFPECCEKGGIFDIKMEALEYALEELVNASQCNSALERFSHMLWDELEPFMTAASDWRAAYQENMEELQDMLLDLEAPWDDMEEEDPDADYWEDVDAQLEEEDKET